MVRSNLILDLNAEIIVDNFAGGGGASSGIEQALGRHPDLAWNHNPEAVRMHEANHPQTRHFCQDVFDADPVTACAGRPVGLAHFSPDCTHFSKARGTKPRSKKIRGLAWVIVRWAFLVRPRVITMENVEEFLTWGPLGEDGQPDEQHRGRTFESFRDVMMGGLLEDNPDIPEIIETVGCGITRADLVRGMGYRCEFREQRASDYGAPTIRKRLFGIMRCDSAPIVWPTPTHGDPRKPGFKQSGLKPWRTAAECIDWSIPCPSIFDRKRPLAEATCRRIAKGIMRHVVNDPAPFIVNVAHGETAPGGSKRWGKGFRSIDEPLPTQAASNDFAVVAPVLTEHANASNPRCNRADTPLRTQCAGVKGGHFSAVTAFLAKHYGGHEGSGWPLAKPMSTVTSVDHHSLVAAHITKFRKGSSGASAAAPMPTITANSFVKRPGGAAPLGVVTGTLVGVGGRAGQIEPRSADVPVQTITGKADTAIAAAHLAKLRGTSTSQDAEEPLHTVSAGGNHFAEVRAFLIKYYGTEQDPKLREPMHTIPTKDRFGLVTVHGEEYAIVDIGLRMLTPRELFNAQGFPSDYIIGDDGRAGLTLTKTAQVRMVGNSVSPTHYAAIVAANVPELAVWDSSDRKNRMAIA